MKITPILAQKTPQHGFRQQTVAQDTQFAKSSLSIRHSQTSTGSLQEIEIDSFKNSFLFKWLQKELPLISYIGLEGFKLTVCSWYEVIQSIDGWLRLAKFDSSFLFGS